MNGQTRGGGQLRSKRNPPGHCFHGSEARGLKTIIIGQKYDHSAISPKDVSGHLHRAEPEKHWL